MCIPRILCFCNTAQSDILGWSSWRRLSQRIDCTAKSQLPYEWLLLWRTGLRTIGVFWLTSHLFFLVLELLFTEAYSKWLCEGFSCTVVISTNVVAEYKIKAAFTYLDTYVRVYIVTISAEALFVFLLSSEFSKAVDLFEILSQYCS
jgi:hypothetical protein